MKLNIAITRFNNGAWPGTAGTPSWVRLVNFVQASPRDTFAVDSADAIALGNWLVAAGLKGRRLDGDFAWPDFSPVPLPSVSGESAKALIRRLTTCTDVPAIDAVYDWLYTVWAHVAPCTDADCQFYWGSTSFRQAEFGPHKGEPSWISDELQAALDALPGPIFDLMRGDWYPWMTTGNFAIWRDVPTCHGASAIPNHALCP